MSLESDESRGAMLTFNGVEDADATEVFDASYLDQVRRWQNRSNLSAPQPAMLEDDSVALVYLSTEGAASEYFPDAGTNDIGESLFREFAERQGELEDVDHEPRCVRVRYKILNESASIHQLLCPCFDEQGTLQGFVIVQPRP